MSRGGPRRLSPGLRQQPPPWTPGFCSRCPPPTVRSMVKVWGSCGNVTSLLRTLHLPQNGEVRAAEATACPQSPARGPETPGPPDRVPFAPSAPAAWTVLLFPPQNASSHHSTFIECLSWDRVSVGTRGCHMGWWRGRGCRTCVGCQAAPLASTRQTPVAPSPCMTTENAKRPPGAEDSPPSGLCSCVVFP